MGTNSNHIKMSTGNSLLGMKQENAKAIAIILIVVVVVVLFAVYANKFLGGVGNALRGVTDSLGLTKSDESKARDQQIKDAQKAANTAGSPWSASFYQGVQGALVLTSSFADSLAYQIYDSVNTWSSNDGPEVVGAIKQCKTKSQVSFLCERFYQKYNQDMYEYITKNYTGNHIFNNPYNDSVISSINTYVNSLPNYNA